VIELTLNGLEPLKFRLRAYPAFVSPAPDDATKAFQSSLSASSDRHIYVGLGERERGLGHVYWTLRSLMVCSRLRESKRL
jgi:hypothetical protein